MKNCLLILILLLVIFSCSQTRNIEPEKPQIIKTIYQTNENELRDLGNGWFEVTGKAFIQNITPEEAKEKAVLDACKKAIEYYTGVEISSRSLDIRAESDSKIVLDQFSSLSNQTTKGIILEKEIISEKIDTDGSILVKIVNLKVKVGKQSGEKDPYFNIDATLNRSYFQDSDEMELTATSSKDCFLTILNICSNDSVYIIFPNQYRKDNFLKSGKVFSLPNENDRKLGITFPVHLLPDRDKDSEMIKILATKKKVNFTSFYSFSAYGTYQSALEDLLRWLIKIPRNEMEEVDIQYFIYK